MTFVALNLFATLKSFTQKRQLTFLAVPVLSVLTNRKIFPGDRLFLIARKTCSVSVLLRVTVMLNDFNLCDKVVLINCARFSEGLAESVISESIKLTLLILEVPNEGIQIALPVF